MSDMKEQRREHLGWVWPLQVTLLILLFYVVMASRATLWDRDEPRFCRATVEMVESGQYLYPTFNGELRLHKPIGIYWLMVLMVKLAGPAEWACRFFCCVGVAVSCGLTYSIARRWVGAMAARWAMLILASSLLMMVMGTMATADGALVAFQTAVLAIYAAVLDRGLRWYHVLGWGVALAGGLLIKGPVGLIPLLVIWISLYWLGRKKIVLPASRKAIVGGTLIGLLLGLVGFLAWALPANAATEGAFYNEGIGHHVVGRSVTALEGHGGEWLLYFPYLLYYLPVIVVGVFPWSLHLPGAISAAWGGRLGQQRTGVLLWTWIIPVVVLMSLVVTKLPHYVLLAWPGLAVMIAATLQADAEGRLDDRDRKWLKGGVWFFIPCAFIGAVGLAGSGWLLELESLKAPGVAAGVVLAAMAQLAARHQLAQRFQVSAKVLIVGMIFFHVPFLFGVIPALEKVKVSPPVAQAIREATGPEVPIATFKYHEPTLNFYCDRQIEMLHRPPDVQAWLDRPGPGVIVLTDGALNNLPKKGITGLDALTPLIQQSGLNVAKGKPVTVWALAKGMAVDQGR